MFAVLSVGARIFRVSDVGFRLHSFFFHLPLSFLAGRLKGAKLLANVSFFEGCENVGFCYYFCLPRSFNRLSD